MRFEPAARRAAEAVQGIVNAWAPEPTPVDYTLAASRRTP